MKKTIIIALAVLGMAFNLSAQVTPVAFAEITGTQVTTPWVIKINTEITAINLLQNGLVSNSFGVGIKLDGDTIVSVDSLMLGYGLQIPQTMVFDVNTENTVLEMVVVTEIVDTTGGGWNVIDTHTSLTHTDSTTFYLGIPASWGHSVTDTTSGGATIHIDSLDGQSGAMFSFVQQSGPGGIVATQLYEVGVQHDKSIVITNCQPNTTYTGRVRANAGGGIVLFTSPVLTFTTQAVTAPLVYLDSLTATSSTQEVEFTVIGNGTNTTSYNLLADGVSVYTNTTVDTAIGSYTLPGLGFGTVHTWQIIATNAGGTASATLSVTTADLDDLSIGQVTHDSTGLHEVELHIPTYSDGGPSNVVVNFPQENLNFPGGIATMGLDTVDVTVTNLTPGSTEMVTITLTRAIDGSTETWTYYITMYEPGLVDISSTGPVVTAVSYGFNLFVDRSINVGGVNAEVELEQLSGLNPGLISSQNFYDASGTLNQSVAYSSLANGTEYRVTVVGKDSLSPHTDRTMVWTFTTMPTPGQPVVNLMPITWSEITWIAEIDFLANPMSLNGASAYLRLSENLATLASPLSNQDTVATPSIGSYTANADIWPYVQAEEDSVYYRIIYVNAEGGWVESPTFSQALPEYVEPPVLGPVEYIGWQELVVDSTAGIIQVWADPHGLAQVTCVMTWYPLGHPEESLAPVSLLNANQPMNFHLADLPDGQNIFFELDFYVAGVYESSYGVFYFTTLNSPTPPNSIEEIVRQNPLIVGDVYNTIGSRIGQGVLLRDLQTHTVSFGNQIVIWRNGDTVVKTESH